jgi:hypothetical protein
MNKLKTYGFLTLIGVLFGVLVWLLPHAIRFFFRGFLLLLENPLEAFSFFFFMLLFSGVWIWVEEKELKKS